MSAARVIPDGHGLHDGALEALVALVVEQARDDASRQVEPERGIADATGLGIDLDQTGAHDGGHPSRWRRRRRRWVRVSWKAIAPADTERWVLLVGLNPWDAADDRSGGDCPVCHGGTLREAAYCVRCDRTGADDRYPAGLWPGIRPGTVLREDCPREYLVRTAYVAPEKGGLSHRVKRRKG